MSKEYLYLVLCALCVFLGGCHRKSYFFRKKLYFSSASSSIERTLGLNSWQNPPSLTLLYPQNKPLTQEPIITIWIHGAQPFRRNTTNLGLKSADSFEPGHDFYQIATLLNKSDPQRFPQENIYFFSWSGRLDFHERKRAAKELYEQLTQLIQEYEQRHHLRPKIYIIAHSHGGNIALNLAKIKDCSLNVEKLILLASPVQDKTAPLIQKSVFKMIYSLYSTLDIIQIIDPQGLVHSHTATTFFSRQRFRPQSNLLQVKVRINGHSFLHHEYHGAPFLMTLPHIIDQLDAWFAKSPIEAHLEDDARFVLSIYTNGRMPPRHKQHRIMNQEHTIIPFPAAPDFD